MSSITSSDNNAILVLESPWEFGADPNRTSVLPFVEGIAKLHGNTEVYFANFYDDKSFEKALDCLCRVEFKNTIVYVAAHGDKRKIGNVDIAKVLFKITEYSKKYSITGIMLGSCFVGKNTSTLEVYIEGSNVRWCAGYKSSCDWLVGTMIDVKIISYMLGLCSSVHRESWSILNDNWNVRNDINQGLADAISCFSPDHVIGQDYDEEYVKLKDSLDIVVRPFGSGHKAKSSGAEVFSLIESSDSFIE